MYKRPDLEKNRKREERKRTRKGSVMKVELIFSTLQGQLDPKRENKQKQKQTKTKKENKISTI